MKILIRSVDDWGEVYVDERFIYDGDWSIMEPIMEFLSKLREVEYLEIRLFEGKGELRKVVVDGVNRLEYDAPLRAVTGQTYWKDWDEAELCPNILDVKDKIPEIVEEE